jgi:hypothetical protein
MPHASFHRFAVCALVALLLPIAGCGGQDKRVAEPGEFTARHAQLFDDGLDLIADPDGLQGRWRTDWQSDLDARIADADWVARGKVTTIHTEVDPEMRTTFHVMFKVAEKLKGEPPEREPALAAREGASGYASIKQHGERILERDFVALVRYALVNGEHVPHFHLMPPSGPVMDALKRYDTRQHPNRIKIIEHKQQ